MNTLEAAQNILNIARESRNQFAVTGREFDKVKANMYSIFECYAHGIIDWDTSRKYFRESIKQYLSFYQGADLKEERESMRSEYRRVVAEYKVAMDEYKSVKEAKLAASLTKKHNLSESVAQAHSETYYKKRALSESELRDTITLNTWQRVMEAYPNLTVRDEDRVRMLTIFEGPTVDTTQMITTVMKEGPNDNIGRRERAPNGQMTGSTRGFDTDHDYFNPNAGHRDQPSHPENDGLGLEQPDPKTGIYPDELEWEPETSPRPKLRPGSDRSTSPRPRLRPESVNEDDRRVVFDVIDSAAAKYGVSPAIARGMADQESGFNQGAVGDGGTAFGLFQVRQPAIDDVNRVYGTNFTIDDVKDMKTNADVAMRYFKMQKDTYGAEDDRTALMMYNGGPGILRRGQKAQSMASKHADRVIKKSANYTPPASAKITKPASTGPDKASIDKAVKQAIAYTGNVTYQDLAKASGIKDPNKIFPGQEIVLPGGGSYTVRKGDTLSHIAQRYNKGRLSEGWKELPPIDRDRYQERPGLEGPFSTLSGKVVYYDPKEGKYYDSDTDMYLSYDEFKALDNDNTGMKESIDAIQRIVTDKQAEKVHGVLVDLFTASAIAQVYDAVNDQNKAAIDKMLTTKAGLMKISDFAMKQLSENNKVNEAHQIDWPDKDEDGDSEMEQHAYNAIRHGMHAYDAYDHVYSMSRERDWLAANKDDIIKMFAQYGLQTEGHSPHPKGSAKYKKHMAAKHAAMNEVSSPSIQFGMFSPGGDAQIENGINHILRKFTDDAIAGTEGDRDRLRAEAHEELQKMLEEMSEEKEYEEAMDTDVRQRSAHYLEKGIIRVYNMLDYGSKMKEDIDAEWAAVKATNNQIKINRFLAGLDQETAKRLTGNQAQLVKKVGKDMVPVNQPYTHDTNPAYADKAAARKDGIPYKDIVKRMANEDELTDRKMTKAEKAKETRLKKKYDDSDMKASMKKQYGDDWEEVYYATIRKQAMEMFKEMTAGAVASVAMPMGKMQRRNKTTEAHPNSKVYDKCWDGYEKVPGKKRGEPGSCRKKD
jgi:LysM repeat protein